MILDDLERRDEFKKCRKCPGRPTCRNDECELGTREREELTEAFPPAIVDDARTCLTLRLEYPPPGLFGAQKRKRWPRRWPWALLQAVRIVDNEARRYEEGKKSKGKKAD